MKIQTFNLLVARLDNHEVVVKDYSELAKGESKIKLEDTTDGYFSSFSVFVKKDDDGSYQLKEITDGGLVVLEYNDLADDLHSKFIEALIDEGLYHYQVLPEVEQVKKEKEKPARKLDMLLYMAISPICENVTVTLGHSLFEQLVRTLNSYKTGFVALAQNPSTDMPYFQYQGVNFSLGDHIGFKTIVIDSDNVTMTLTFKNQQGAEWLLS